MAAGIRKCLDLGPSLNDPWVNLTDPVTFQKVLDTRTKWIRTWINWAWVEYSPGNYRWDAIQQLDAVITKARQNNIGVVLCTWYFPKWANGTANVDEPTYRLRDRDRGGGKRKELEFGIPQGQLGVNGYWGKWIQFLFNRYHNYGCGVILEIMNEPNLQWWPQQDSQGNITSGCDAAQMMQTAASIASWYPADQQMPIAAPAMSDTRRSTTPLDTRYNDFLVNVKAGLENLSFRGTPTFMWSHHNYADIEMWQHVAYDAVWNMLKGWWRGWSATTNDGSNPAIWITEGGARLNEVNNSEALQGERVRNNYTLMAMASGAAMFTNYQLHTTDYDSGLMRRYPSTFKRPVWQTFYDMAPNY
jgi:hypothetical protein